MRFSRVGLLGAQTTPASETAGLGSRAFTWAPVRSRCRSRSSRSGTDSLAVRKTCLGAHSDSLFWNIAGTHDFENSTSSSKTLKISKPHFQ